MQNLPVKALKLWSIKQINPKRIGAIREAFNTCLLAKQPNKNKLNLTKGIQQRENVLPESVLLDGSNKQVGFYQPNQITSEYQRTAEDDEIWETGLKLRERHVRIFVPPTSHMHCTPSIEDGLQWCVQFEHQGIYKTPNMGWTFSNDVRSDETNYYFDDLEDAIKYARNNGLAYEIKYPKERYVTRKNYADNFKWRGHPKPEEDIA